MKKNALLPVAMILSFSLFCQRPFLPLGAKWGGVVQCVPTWAQCGPGFPHYVDKLPGGLYSWSLRSEGRVTGAGKVVVIRE